MSSSPSKKKVAMSQETMPERNSESDSNHMFRKNSNVKDTSNTQLSHNETEESLKENKNKNMIDLLTKKNTLVNEVHR